MKMRTVVLSVATFMLTLLLGTADAAVTLPWSTTYNCPEWKQSDGLNAVNCDGMQGYGAWTTANGSEAQITLSANNPQGGGGRGQRQWIGDGNNNNSGGIRVSFATPQPELWMRWYMRYQAGFTWSSIQGDKWLYFDPGTGHEVYLGWWTLTEDNVFSYSPGNGGNRYSPAGFGWVSTMGGLLGDGRWHLYEVHLKTNTNGANGVSEMWIDGRRAYSYSDLDYGGMPWSFVVIGENQRYPLNGQDVYVDFDDVAISNTGYIGPLYPTGPAAPKNLRVQ